MIQSLLFLITSLTVFLILTEILKIDISYGDKTVVDFNFTIFAIRFTSDNSPNKKKKKRRNRRKISNFLYFISPILSKSEIVLHHISVLLPYDSPSDYAVKRGAYISLLSSLLAYVDAEAKKLVVNDITFGVSANNNYKISYSVSFTVSLLNFLTFLPVFFKRRHEERRKLLWQKIK